MKDFLKNVCATVLGFFLSIGLMMLFMFVSLIGMIVSSASASKQEITDNSVLVVNLAGDIVEKADNDFFAMLTGNEMQTNGLNDILAAIDKAKTNKKIKGIYLQCGVLSTDYASLQEIRRKLIDFKKSGKWVVAYADTYMQGAYYLASVADKIYLNPQGHVDIHGVGSQIEFYRDFLAKIGVSFKIVKVGTFKSATEPYTEDHMSDANREQVQVYINGLWQNVVSDITASRKITAAQLNEYADGVMALDDASTLVSRKLVDKLLYADQVKAEVKKLLSLDDDDDITKVGVAQMASSEGEGVYGDDGDKVAVYYCSGNIVMSQTTSFATGGGGIVATQVCSDLEKLKNDEDVKAVVIRINSGGGDAYASEQLWHYISELKKVKPVVISMGGAAASGGYYMACNASYIYAEPTTITGSIGIFGMFPDCTELLTQKLGLKFDEVKTNKNSNFSPVGIAHSLTADETAYLQSYINRGYSLFRKRVADGRKMKVEDVEKIAQGRVWLGQDAIKLGLVDALGTLEMAVKKAADLAKVKEYYIADYPAAPDFATQLMGAVDGSSYIDNKMRLMLGSYYEPFTLLRSLENQSPVQARMPIIMKLN